MEGIEIHRDQNLDTVGIGTLQDLNHAMEIDLIVEVIIQEGQDMEIMLHDQDIEEVNQDQDIVEKSQNHDIETKNLNRVTEVKNPSQDIEENQDQSIEMITEVHPNMELEVEEEEMTTI